MRRPAQAQRKNTPLTPEQKKSVLEQMYKKSKYLENQNDILIQLYNDIKENNSFGYPPILVDMIKNLFGPYQHFDSETLNEGYDKLITDYLRENGIRLFQESCKSPEWENGKIHLLSEKFSLKYEMAHTVKFVIRSGKIIWQLFWDGQVVFPRHKFSQKEYLGVLQMTLPDFHELKISGKRKPKLIHPLGEFLEKNHQGDVELVRRDRSPRKGKTRNHSDPDLCHICTWDVGEYDKLGLHKKSSHAGNNEKNYNCCGEDRPLDLDHIPAKSLLKKMQKVYPEMSDEFEGGLGYVIAIPKVQHEFISASYKIKAQNRDLVKESQNPGQALLTDIRAYFKYYEDSNQLSLKILGAFRYLYRKNVQRFEDFSCQELDKLFLRAISFYLNAGQEDKLAIRPKNEPINRRGAALFQEDDSSEKDTRSFSNRNNAPRGKK